MPFVSYFYMIVESYFTCRTNSHNCDFRFFSGILLRAFYDRKKDKKGYLDLFETALDNLSNISHYFIDDTPNTSLLL